MDIKLDDVGKRFNEEWIFRHLTFELLHDKRYAITGPNGSGKSTLLQTIAGYIHHNEGTIQYTSGGHPIAAEHAYKYCALSAPYLDVIEEMTLKEFLSFHHKMKGFTPGYTINEIAESVSLGRDLNKQIRHFSSGMKQRVKLAQAFYAAAEVLLLDEPLSNLDEAGVATYYSLINKTTEKKLVIISSNDEKEYSFCDEILRVTEFK